MNRTGRTAPPARSASSTSTSGNDANRSRPPACAVPSSRVASRPPSLQCRIRTPNARRGSHLAAVGTRASLAPCRPISSADGSKSLDGTR
ncbi:hypothetical protein ACOZE3_33175 [Streptomyces cinereoruber]|uniref:hypothetical protein n=1 Tax=Streptomyces cinereoruber TaxID=67260 RepID=UPI003BF45E2B